MRPSVVALGALALVACGSFHGNASTLASEIASWKLDAAILSGIGERSEGQPVNAKACEVHLADIKSAAADCKAETMAVEAQGELCQASTKTQPSNCLRCENMLALEKSFAAAKCRLG